MAIIYSTKHMSAKKDFIPTLTHNLGALQSLTLKKYYMWVTYSGEQTCWIY